MVIKACRGKRLYPLIERVRVHGSGNEYHRNFLRNNSGEFGKVFFFILRISFFPDCFGEAVGLETLEIGEVEAVPIFFRGDLA